MKKMWITMVLCGYLAMNLTACQSTPEEAVVVDKSEGLPPESILEVDNENPKELEVPKIWDEILEKDEGFITLTADCEIEIPEVYSVPVYSYEMRELTNKDLSKLCQYFAGENELYREPLMTKAELIEEKKKLSERVGHWTYYGYSELYEIEKMLDELISDAPEKREKMERVEAAFSKPYQTTLEKYKEMLGAASSKYSKFYFDTDENIGFKVRVNNGEKVHPYIYAMNYDPDLGSTTCFLYSQGTFQDEKIINESLRNAILSQTGEEYENYLNKMLKKMEQKDYGTFTENDALQRGEEILSDLELDGYKVDTICKAIGNSNIESLAEFENEAELQEIGYSIYYSFKQGDLIGYEQPLRKPHKNLPETIYAPYFAVEQIHMVITEEGVRRFEWDNISERKDVIAENVKILTFDEMKDALMNHLFYTGIAMFGEDTKSMEVRFEYRVKNVELRMGNVTAFNDSYAVWLVPVWVVTVEKDMISKAMGTNPLPDEYVVLNAIDGGYVRPQIDPRMEW